MSTNNMEATPRERFEAAVKVIQTMPKNGSFKPSHALMLKFYGFFKQANAGPCNDPKPAFYDVIGKAKWEAWNSLGDMSSEDAMIGYVEELKKIIETMPASQMVTDFISKLGDFYELVDEDRSRDYNRLKPLLSMNRDDPMSNGSSGSSPHRSDTDLDSIDDDIGSSQTDEQYDDDPPRLDDPGTNGPLVDDAGTTGPLGSDDDSDADEFCDTMDAPVVQWEKLNGIDGPEPLPGHDHHNGHAHKMTEGPLPVSTSIKRDVSSSSFTLGPSQLSDRNFSTSDFMATERAEEMADALVTRGGGEVTGDRGNPGPPQTGRSTNSGTQATGGTMVTSSSRVSHGRSAGGAGGGRQSQQIVKPYQGTNVNEQISAALDRLQRDMNTVLTRLDKLESLAESKISPWLPFPMSYAKTVFYLVVWPLIFNWVFRFLRRNRSRKH